MAGWSTNASGACDLRERLVPLLVVAGGEDGRWGDPTGVGGSGLVSRSIWWLHVDRMGIIKGTISDTFHSWEPCKTRGRRRRCLFLALLTGLGELNRILLVVVCFTLLLTASYLW